MYGPEIGLFGVASADPAPGVILERLTLALAVPAPLDAGPDLIPEPEAVEREDAQTLARGCQTNLRFDPAH